MLQRLFEIPNRRNLDEKSGAGLLARGILSNVSLAGINVTPENALQASVVHACVRVLADSIAMLPLVIYERVGDRGKRRAIEHPLYSLLHDAPNDEMTAFNFRQTLMEHLCLRGNAYTYIESDARGRIVALWPLNPDGVQIVRDQRSYELFYGVELPERFGREYRFIPSENIWHLRGLSKDGIIGYSPIRMAREAIGLALATESYGAAFFGNGAEPGFVLIHPGKLGTEAYTRLKSSWENRHQGFEKAHRVAILEEGMKPEKLGVSNDDAQFLETRKFQATDIARIFRVPPHMIADLDRATFSNIEHLGIEFVVYSLMPWLVNIEQSISLTLMRRSERVRYYPKHVVEGLLRGDVESRYSAYATARQWGWMSANDIRELEDQNPLPPDVGDLYLTPLNMMPVGEETALPAAETPPDEGRMVEIEKRRAIEQRQQLAARRRLMETYQPILTGEIERVFRRERQDLLTAARRIFKTRSISDFMSYLDDFYREHAAYVAKVMQRVMGVYADLTGAAAADEIGKGDAYDSDLVRRFVNGYVDAFVSREEYSSRERIQNALRRAQADGVDAVDALEAEMADWDTTRAETSGRYEAVRLNGATAAFVFSVLGVMSLVWRNMGESNCPYCASLEGKRVGIKESFLAQGDMLSPDGAEPFAVQQDHRHPPLHGGCDCMIAAG